jgi:tRNA 2-thiouridine synthesizing protein D
MNFAICVCSSPYSSQASYSAYQYAKSLLAQGHQLYRVFFYQDGIHNGTRLAAPPSDEFDLYQAWQSLASDYKLDLVICIAAALKRGVLNDEESLRYQKDAHNLAPGFTLGGLGQLIDAAVNADRLITFGY